MREGLGGASVCMGKCPITYYVKSFSIIKALPKKVNV
jgi:hypothetical protein